MRNQEPHQNTVACSLSSPLPPAGLPASISDLSHRQSHLQALEQLSMSTSLLRTTPATLPKANTTVVIGNQLTTQQTAGQRKATLARAREARRPLEVFIEAVATACTGDITAVGQSLAVAVANASATAWVSHAAQRGAVSASGCCSNSTDRGPAPGFPAT